jgi:hypothetical protein
MRTVGSVKVSVRRFRYLLDKAVELCESVGTALQEGNL